MAVLSLLASAGRTKVTPVTAAVGGVTAAAWVVLATGVVGHPSHDHLLGGHHGPGPGEVAMFFAGWLLMVLAMMLPAELPQLAAGGFGQVRRWAAAARLVAATCAVWTLFAAVALAGDAVLHRLAESWQWLADHHTVIRAAVLITAGAFQLSVSGRRLHHAARAPQLPPARHAVACLGSCGPLMLVMFAVGTGSLLWMAVLTVAMCLERTATVGSRLVPLTGVALVGAGLLAL